MERPSISLSAVVLDAPDARELASFYSRLLGWPVRVDEGEWVMLRAPEGATSLSFQTEEIYQRPRWPERDGQQMMLHLDLQVDDLETACAHAIACGATLAEFQPQEDVRVFFDPAGHPFCLWVESPG
jgi:catechol 2,3-dioxygenase-like lactoylglutathione lyase family enzyme